MRRALLLLSVITILLILTLLFWNINPDIFLYSIKNRSIKILAIIIIGSSISAATLMFQTVTTNRILSPSILGLDSLYILFQFLVVTVFSRYKILVQNEYINFGLSTLLMSVFSVILFTKIFSKQKSVYLIILIGVIMGSFFSSITGMLQTLMDPDSYTSILDRLFASFSNINEPLLIGSFILLLLVLFLVVKKHRVLDVLSLGRDSTVNLGVDYVKEINYLLVLIFVLTSVSTALVGPITFLGFFAVNISKMIFKTFRHKYLIPSSILIGISTLTIGQFLIEVVFKFSIPVSVLISIVGGIYFIYLLLRESKLD